MVEFLASILRNLNKMKREKLNDELRMKTFVYNNCLLPT